jgi:hypothetical protein
MPRDAMNRPGVAALGFAALGVVFGDIGTSPLYTLKTVLDLTGDGSPATVLGVVSLIVWTLIVITTVKYVTIAMRVDNDGEGGILALMGPRCDHASGPRSRTYWRTDCRRWLSTRSFLGYTRRSSGWFLRLEATGSWGDVPLSDAPATGVQDGDDADLGAEPAWVGCERHHRPRGSPERDRIDGQAGDLRARHLKGVYPPVRESSPRVTQVDFSGLLQERDT